MIKILSKEQCCGCSACIQICPKRSIDFQEDIEGFLYPRVNMDTCIDCGLCEKVCPIVNQAPERYPINVYAAKHPNDDIRVRSSSGGLFTFFAEQVINEGGVVFGARFNDKWEVVHSYTETKEGLVSFRGSKYVQSNIGDSYKQVEIFLKTGRKVMFTGTPCQVAGLRKYLKVSYANLLTVDFVCHGVPSPRVWKMYLSEELANHNHLGKLTEISFRDKTRGWKNFSFVLKFSKNSAIRDQRTVLSSVFYDNIYMQSFLSDLTLRPSCYECHCKAGRSGADVTIGDFWGIDKCRPDIDDDRGVSLIMAYSDAFSLPKNVSWAEMDYRDALKYNMSIAHSSHKPIYRDLLFVLLNRSNKCKKALRTCCSNNYFNRFRRLLYRLLGI